MQFLIVNKVSNMNMNTNLIIEHFALEKTLKAIEGQKSSKRIKSRSSFLNAMAWQDEIDDDPVSFKLRYNIML